MSRDRHCVLFLNPAQVANFGVIASSSLSHMGLASVLQANLGLTQNKELCLRFFCRCVDFRDIIISFDSFIGYPTFSRVRSSDELLGAIFGNRGGGCFDAILLRLAKV